MTQKHCARHFWSPPVENANVENNKKQEELEKNETQ